MKRLRTLGAAATTLMLALAISLSACDTASPDSDVAASLSEDSGDLATLLIADLALNGTQESQVSAVFDKYGVGQEEPGALWYVAAELQQQLTDEQKQRLFDKAAEGPGEGYRSGFGQGGDHRGDFRRNGSPTGGFGPLADILTDEQKEQAQAIHDSVREQLEAIREAVDAGTMTADEAHEQVRAIREDVRAQIEALLTDDQKAEIEALRAEREAEREQMREAANAVRNEVLDLTDDEAAAFDETAATQREAAQQIREEVRNGALTREEAHAAMLSLRDERYSELGGILDETQLEIVEIHDALATRMSHHGMRGQRGQGQGQGQGHGMRHGGGGPGQFSGSGFGFGSRG